jgi:hypothetical protein
MKIELLTAAFLLVASFAFAQVPVLRCHEDVCDTVTQHVQVTPAILEGLKARQFVYVPPSDLGRGAPTETQPTVTIVPDSAGQLSNVAHAQHLPPTYPLTPNSYPNTPFYPPIYPSFYPYPGFSEGFGSLQPAPVVVIVKEHEAPRVQPLPSAPSPAPPPAKDAPRGSLSLERLNSVR